MNHLTGDALLDRCIPGIPPVDMRYFAISEFQRTSGVTGQTYYNICYFTSVK